MKFEDELKEFYENRSKYRFIKPDVIAQDWCVYIFGKKKEFYKSLGIAKVYVDSILEAKSVSTQNTEKALQC